MVTKKMPTKLARQLSKGDKIIVPNGTAKVLDTNNITTRGLPTKAGEIIHVKVSHTYGPIKGESDLLFFGGDVIDMVPKKEKIETRWYKPWTWSMFH